MALFLGDQDFVLDDKGRLAIPAKLRDALPESDRRLAIINGLDGCLVMIPAMEMDALMRRFQSSRFLAEGPGRRFQRNYFLGSSIEKLDSQGRVLLNHRQIEHAGLAKKEKARVFGAGDHIEVWNIDRFESGQVLGPDDPTMEELAADFFKPLEG